jgi:hypothetical protein
MASNASPYGSRLPATAIVSQRTSCPKCDISNWRTRSERVHAPARRKFTVLATTNVSLPLGTWRVLGVAVEDPPGHYQFTDFNAMDYPRRFYCRRCP